MFQAMLSRVPEGLFHHLAGGPLCTELSAGSSIRGATPEAVGHPPMAPDLREALGHRGDPISSSGTHESRKSPFSFPFHVHSSETAQIQRWAAIHCVALGKCLSLSGSLIPPQCKDCR